MTDGKDSEKRHNRVKQVMAIIAIVFIVIFIISASVCVALGNTQLMMAALFCLVAVPILIYFLIWIYDRAHRYDKEEEQVEAGIGSASDNGGNDGE